MKVIVLLAFLLVGASAWTTKLGRDPTETMKGLKCAICTATLELTTQYLVLHPEPVSDFVRNHLCQLFNETAMNFFCNQMIYFFGDTAVAMLLNQSNADTICQTLMLCENPSCRIRPTGVLEQNLEASQSFKPTFKPGVEKLDFDPWAFLQELLDHLSVKHLPLLDGDGDRYSIYPTLRGYMWRGKDCDDSDPNIYPGRKENPYPDRDVDYDCNGIHGTDPETGKTWEDLLCGNTTRYGLGIVGDSVGAHFSIPPEYLTASKINGNTFNNFVANIANEFDLPHQSMTTGFMNDTKETPVRSLYKYMLERNRCNFRDYQNIAVNGGETNNTVVNIQALSRNTTKDHPMIVVMELIGNDVCLGINQTTPPDFFKDGLIKRMEYLDTVLPKGSHLIMIGMVNGSLLYDYLHDQPHPIGVTYRAVYDYLNCLHINPCPGWLNSNGTIRHMTTEAAVQINNQYHAVMKEGRVFNNFDYTFYEFPAIEIMTKWISQGGKPQDLVEPVDGFHSNQLFNALAADWLWENLQQDKPEWLGEVNPNNDRIKQLFGDQGGYF